MIQGFSLKNIKGSPFQVLHWRLLASYLLVMSVILLISDILIYGFFSRSLYQQLDNRLLNLAQAASHSLNAIKANPEAVNVNKTEYHFDRDGDLDIPWQNLRKRDQTIEWFGSNRQRLAQSGKMSIDLPVHEGFKTFQKGTKYRSVTLSAYSYSQRKKTLEGYIRASESSEDIEMILNRLRWGFYLGGLTAVGLITIGGMELTRQAIKPIEESYQQLKQFTADASHELRTPLTAIKTSVEVLQTHPERVHPADADKLQGIVSATNQMSRLVEDLLWLARSDASLDGVSQEWMIIPLGELLEDVIEFLDLKAEAKEITLKFVEETSVFVRGEPLQLRRLFSNLVDNGIKYTPRGGRVRVTLEKMGEFGVVMVEDTGMGIANQHLSLIFNRFWREEAARYHQEGSGLGLAIAKAIAENHGGNMSVSSTLGVGTCFKVCLPIANSDFT